MESILLEQELIIMLLIYPLKGTSNFVFLVLLTCVCMCVVDSIKLAKKRFEVFDLKGHIQVGNAEVLSNYFPSDFKFDLIYSFGSLFFSV